MEQPHSTGLANGPDASAVTTFKPIAQTTRILVVEDEQDIGGLIKHALERDGYTRVELVGTGDAALKAVVDDPPDLIILDLNLPVLSGFEVCRILRSRPNTRHLPIIMVTARTNEVDRIAGLDMGADDYVTKPFSLRELSARVRALLRRSQGRRRTPVLQVGTLRIDTVTRDVRVGETAVEVSAMEYALLTHLAADPRRVFTKHELLRDVWGFRAQGRTRTLDSHACRLRHKLTDAGGGRLIENIWGVGYRLAPLDPREPTGNAA